MSLYKKWKKIFTFLSWLLFSLSCYSSESNFEKLIREAKKQNLSEDQYWLKILHYRKDIFGNYKSDIKSTNYFLSANGSTSPESELDATLFNFFQDHQQDLKNKSACKYPSRYLWLNKKLKLDEKFGISTCPQLNLFTRNNSIKSISVIFATGYFANPASFFGHPLLKFNFSEIENNDLLDSTINYGAFTPAKENLIIYALKGLTGFYNAGYTATLFHTTEQMYGENELRDLWEYELDLSKDQINEISNHIFELMNASFPYYFLSDNCAYRIAELLEMFTNKKLLPKNVPYAIPFSLFDNLNNQEIIKNIKYHPSRQTRFQNKFNVLNKEEQIIVHNLIQKENVTSNETYLNSNENSKIKITEALINYYAFAELVNNHSSKDLENKNKYILERIKLPKSEKEESYKPPPPPHLGQKSVQTQIGYIKTTENSSISIHLRPAYYDYLTPTIGHLNNSQLEIFSTDFNFYNSKLHLEALDFISVETLNISQTNLPNDGGVAWGLKLGIQKSYLDLKNKNILNLEGNIGLGANINDRIVVFCLLDNKIESSFGHTYLYTSPRCGALFELQQRLKTKLQFKKYFGLKNDKKFSEIEIENRFGQSRDWDIRVGFSHLKQNSVKFAYSLYW